MNVGSAAELLRGGLHNKEECEPIEMDTLVFDRDAFNSGMCERDMYCLCVCVCMYVSACVRAHARVCMHVYMCVYMHVCHYTGSTTFP